MKVMRIASIAIAALCLSQASFACGDGSCYGGFQNKNLTLGYDLSTWNKLTGGAYGNDWTYSFGSTQTDGGVWLDRGRQAQGWLGSSTQFLGAAASRDKHGNGSQTYVRFDTENLGSLKTYGPRRAQSENHYKLLGTGSGFAGAVGDKTSTFTLLEYLGHGDLRVGEKPSAALHFVGTSLAEGESSGNNGGGAKVDLQVGLSSSSIFDAGTSYRVPKPKK